MKRLTLLLVVTLLAIVALGCPSNVTHYREDDGSLVYVGNFSNDGDLALVNADIQATAYDAAGIVMATASNSMCEILPGRGVLPFEVTFPPGTGDPASVEFKVVGTPTAEPYLATGLQAYVVGQTTDILGFTWVTGELTNTSANHYYEGHICASWTDAAGNVIRMAWGETASIDLPSGKSIPFALMTKLPPDALNINFYLDAGVVPAGEPVYPVVTLPANAFKEKFLNLPEGKLGFIGMGEIYNTTSAPIASPRISATYRDANGNLLAAGQSLDFCGGDILPPGAFTFGGYMAPTVAGQPQLEVQAYDYSSIESYRFTASQVRVQASGLVGSMTGAIKNTSGKTLTRMMVCGGAYDSKGLMIGANSAWPTLPAGGLAPGASFNFTLDLPVVFGVASTGKAFAVGRP